MLGLHVCWNLSIIINHHPVYKPWRSHSGILGNHTARARAVDEWSICSRYGDCMVLQRICARSHDKSDNIHHWNLIDWEPRFCPWCLPCLWFQIEVQILLRSCLTVWLSMCGTRVCYTDFLRGDSWGCWIWCRAGLPVSMKMLGYKPQQSRSDMSWICSVSELVRIWKNTAWCWWN